MLIENESFQIQSLDSGTFLGPARVCQAAGRRVQLEFPDERPWALMALAYPYDAAPGDIVLAVGQGPNWYVIGVLAGAGKTSLLVPGDLEVCAPHGSINLTAANGVEIQSPKVKVSAHDLEFVARSIFEQFINATRWVKESFQFGAGRIRTHVEGDYRLQAQRIIEQAEADVKIDGTKIHLG